MDEFPIDINVLHIDLDEIDLSTLLSIENSVLSSVLEEVIEQKVITNKNLYSTNWGGWLDRKHGSHPASYHSMHYQHRMHAQHRMHTQHYMHRMHAQHRMHSMTRW